MEHNIRPLIAGNWKMNGLRESLAEAHKISAFAASACDVLICPPFTLLYAMINADPENRIAYGGQDCHIAETGAHTGDISAAMLKDCGADYVIIGHSERRQDHHETSALIAAKQKAAHAAGLVSIVCVGEAQTDREAGRMIEFVTGQLVQSLTDTCTAANTVIAYEPIWAIGTGLTAQPQQISEMHAAIRTYLQDRFGAEGEAMRILYGGSVKPDNAANILSLPNVNGALVGGASLTADSFTGIIAACDG